VSQHNQNHGVNGHKRRKTRGKKKIDSSAPTLRKREKVRSNWSGGVSRKEKKDQCTDSAGVGEEEQLTQKGRKHKRS